MKLSRFAFLISISLVAAVVFAAAVFAPAFAYVVDAAVTHAPAIALTIGALALPALAAWHLWNMARQGEAPNPLGAVQSRFPAPQSGTPELTAFA